MADSGEGKTLEVDVWDAHKIWNHLEAAYGANCANNGSQYITLDMQIIKTENDPPFKLRFKLKEN
jgi:hypothetical protein